MEGRLPPKTRTRSRRRLSFFASPRLFPFDVKEPAEGVAFLGLQGCRGLSNGRGAPNSQALLGGGCAPCCATLGIQRLSALFLLRFQHGSSVESALIQCASSVDPAQKLFLIWENFFFPSVAGRGRIAFVGGVRIRWARRREQGRRAKLAGRGRSHPRGAVGCGSMTVEAKGRAWRG